MKNFGNPFFSILQCNAFALFLGLVFAAFVHAEPAPGLSSITPRCALPGAEVSVNGHGFGARNVTVGVAGIQAEVLKANGNAATFLVPSGVSPGMTQVTVTNPGGQSGAIDFQVKHAEICANRFDDDCDGGVDELDECPVTSLTVSAQPALSFEAGKSAALATAVDFTSSSTSVPFTVEVSQSVTPSSGLTLTPALETVLNFTASRKTDYTQTLTASQPGTYQVTTTARIVETGQTQSAATTVTVRPAPVSDEISMRLDFDWGVDPLPLGDAAAISTSYSFYPKDRTKSYTVRFEQTITPETGLQLQPSLDGTVIPIPSGVNNVTKSQGQQIVTTQEGDYDLVTTATVVETGQSVTAKTHIHVAPAGSPDLGITVPVLTGDSALAPDIVTSFEVWIEILGKDADEVQGVTLEEKRTGQHWTFQKDETPFVYSGMVTLDTHGMAPDDCFTFRASVHTTKGDAPSRESKLCVTGLPLEFTHTTKEEIDAGFTTSGGTKVAKDLFMVRFKPDVPETRIREIIAAHGGTIVGARPEDKAVEVRLIPPPASLRELAGVMYRLSEQPEVLWMDMTYYLDGSLSLETSDPKRDQQSYLQQIRADEAWYIARGKGKAIAVFDTGIDISHPDVQSKLLRGSDGSVLGYDYGDHDPQPYDENGHGSHVAGIAAGVTDNGLGIAGIAWDAQILPIKVTLNSGREWLAKDLVPAIKSLKKHKDVKIVNMSFGAMLRKFGWFCQTLVDDGWISGAQCELQDRPPEEAAEYAGYASDICTAIWTAVRDEDKLFVASAGNNGHDEQHYPAACAPVVAVAAVDAQDARPEFSEYGSWVDIAAPGVDIYSTVQASGYDTKTGTSQAAPMVAGAAALVWAQNPKMKSKDVIERLKKTAKKLDSPEPIGSGRLDVFEAVFNGDFEADSSDADSLAGWEHFHCAANVMQLDSDRHTENECTQTAGWNVVTKKLALSLSPKHGSQMAYLTTLPAGQGNKVKLRRRFDVQPEVTRIPVSYDYAIISDAYPESFGFFLGDDRMLATLESGLGTSNEIIWDLEDIDLSRETGLGWQRLFGYFIPGGDSSTGWTKWRSKTVYVAVEPGSGEFVIRLDDAQNPWNDTEVLIDNIRFRDPNL